MPQLLSSLHRRIQLSWRRFNRCIEILHSLFDSCSLDRRGFRTEEVSLTRNPRRGGPSGLATPIFSLSSLEPKSLGMFHLNNHISPSVVCVINRQNNILKYGMRGHFRYRVSNTMCWSLRQVSVKCCKASEVIQKLLKLQK